MLFRSRFPHVTPHSRRTSSQLLGWQGRGAAFRSPVSKKHKGQRKKDRPHANYRHPEDNLTQYIEQYKMKNTIFFKKGIDTKNYKLYNSVKLKEGRLPSC